MKKRIIHSNITVPADHQTPEVAEPRESTLDFPSSLVPSHLAAIVVFAAFVVAPVWANQFNTSLLESSTQRVTVIALVSNQTLWFLARPAPSFSWNSDAVQRFFEQRNLRRGRRVQVVSQRNTLAVDHHHPLRSLAAFGLSDAFAPFFAGAKLPSINASLQSSCPFSSSSERNARQRSSHTPCSSQSLSLRQHVEGLGYRLGKSAQTAPVRRTQRMPSKTLRLSAQGLPPFLFGFGFGRSGSIFCHCLSVNFHRSLAIENTPFDSRIYISSLLAQV